MEDLTQARKRMTRGRQSRERRLYSSPERICQTTKWLCSAEGLECGEDEQDPRHGRRLDEGAARQEQGQIVLLDALRAGHADAVQVEALRRAEARQCNPDRATTRSRAAEVHPN